jgi:Tfp pilus assembly protein PilF
MLMRFTPMAASLALTLACIGSVAIGQAPDSQINPRSAALTRAGLAALAAGQYSAARDSLETALAVDPKNREAFGALGKVAMAQGLPGQAVRLYREALLIEPNDLGALQGQGEALVQRGAVDRAKANLVRIRTLCKAECAPATRLAAVIAKGPPPAVATAQANTAVPPKGEEEVKVTQ